MKNSEKKVEKVQQLAHMQPFHQILSELYGQEVSVQIQPAPSLHIKTQEITEREKTLLQWMFEYMQKQSAGMVDPTASLPVVLKKLWKLAERSVDEREQDVSSEFDPLQTQTTDAVISQLQLPVVCIYLDIGKNHTTRLNQDTDKHTNDSHNIVQMDSFEIIKELASGYNIRSILTPITSSQVGVLVPSKHASNSKPDLDELVEECNSWVDALLAEVFIEAKVGISTFITTHAQLLQGMAEAIHACNIGCLNGSKYGVFAYNRLGVQRILYNLGTEERDKYRESILSRDCYKSLGQELRETALAFFRNHLNISETARILYMHRNSLLYRLDKIRELTGYDIRKFEDAVTFWTALMLWKIDNAAG